MLEHSPTIRTVVTFGELKRALAATLKQNQAEEAPRQDRQGREKKGEPERIRLRGSPTHRRAGPGAQDAKSLAPLARGTANPNGIAPTKPERRSWPRENAKNTKNDALILKLEDPSDFFPLKSFLDPLCALFAFFCGHAISEFGLKYFSPLPIKVAGRMGPLPTRPRNSPAASPSTVNYLWLIS